MWDRKYYEILQISKGAYRFYNGYFKKVHKRTYDRKRLKILTPQQVLQKSLIALV